eukprot:CAMPEP_0175932018 /NCGR_PEP_ID=MMETSP0108-20121206/19162_1 /TAXON_ID=195067 ORGANISM="Goniomonas pacifica, Strain CCMP1869" /NCGR_SAMPLE_ID=MMETSP0108 /ASSEMBLY_ACC=CAM_ASM_000204 /LENGTH=146 /DNA_ID=CAMNT_0017255621 /DNA_START=59 /DNA_END=499 /DNA_ORIENTATION=+
MASSTPPHSTHSSDECAFSKHGHEFVQVDKGQSQCSVCGKFDTERSHRADLSEGLVTASPPPHSTYSSDKCPSSGNGHDLVQGDRGQTCVACGRYFETDPFGYSSEDIERSHRVDLSQGLVTAFPQHLPGLEEPQGALAVEYAKCA